MGVQLGEGEVLMTKVITYRDAVAVGLTQEMERDRSVVLIGEDIGAAGGVFKATVGLLDKFGPERVRDTPISEQAIIGAAMGAAMSGLRPVAELMFADFLSVCHDVVANQIAKARYMTNGQITLPLVVRFGNGAGLRFGAQHSQSVESWLMAVPGLKVVVPSTPADVIGLMAAAIRDDDPVMFLEEKALYSTSGEIPDGEHVDELGTARCRREGSDVTIVSLGTMVHRALGAADQLAAEGIDCAVIDLRSLVPLDVSTVANSVGKTGRLFTVEENPRLCGWGAELASIIVEDYFYDLDAPIRRITSPHIPLPAADSLEDATIPSVERIAASVRGGLG
jgi:pyruvate dehydrogenase E1 component beta subunit